MRVTLEELLTITSKVTKTSEYDIQYSSSKDMYVNSRSLYCHIACRYLEYSPLEVSKFLSYKENQIKHKLDAAIDLIDRSRYIRDNYSEILTSIDMKMKEFYKELHK